MVAQKLIKIIVACLLFVIAILLVPLGCAHSYPWLEDDSNIESGLYVPEKQSFKYLNRSIKGLSVDRLKELVCLPDKEIDIATSTLLLSKEFNPELDIKKYLSIIDEMARELAKDLEEPSTPTEVVDKFRNYLFVRKGFLPIWAC